MNRGSKGIENISKIMLNQRFFGLSIVCSECRKGVRDMCMYCKNSTSVESTTTHVVNYKNCIIVIKNVPALNVNSAEKNTIQML